jgi:hypothetical protein
MWRARFGRGFGPVKRQTAKGMMNRIRIRRRILYIFIFHLSGR